MNEHEILLKIQDAIDCNIPDNFLIIKEKIILLEESKGNPKKRIIFAGWQIAAAALLLLILTGSATVAAYCLSGGEFFSRFYAKIVPSASAEQVFMDDSQFEAIASSTVGTAVDTEELRIEVLGAIAGGNASVIMLRVTAKQFDRAEEEQSDGRGKKYMFDVGVFGSISENCKNTYMKYIYPKDAKELMPNQFEMLYTLIGKEPFAGREYDLELHDFIQFSPPASFEKIYPGIWKIPIKFDIKTDIAESVEVNREVGGEAHRFTLKKIDITPLTVSISLEGKVKDNVAMSEAIDYLQKEIQKIEITFRKGSVLDSNNFTVASTGSMENREGADSESTACYRMDLTFNRPVIVENMRRITFMGTTCEISPEHE